MPTPKAAYMSTFQTPMNVNSLSSGMALRPSLDWPSTKPTGDVSGCLAHSRGRLRSTGVSS